ncbi:uncharacterized protein LOC107268684 isoform X2 [Cephus cinctus]|uniref:Uncharacterized protein LOC107268684 isoform X2 n=1 Tax=Cephus cinctus TaxID=211228 RepID=A0AAJ7W245_CEPCN|nr:uncharacterized protein LOC107268684 isoform X2 [Cephus cinctus]
MEDFNDGVDGKLASRLRKVNPEQFHTLVKMHLSFELDLNTEDFESSLDKICAPSCQCVLHTLGNVWREAKNLVCSSSPSVLNTGCNQPFCFCDCVAEKAKEKKWGLLSFSKKPKSTMNLQKGMEGIALTQEGIIQVKQLIKYLSKEQSIVQEGIFRRTGKLTRQQDLKTALCQGVPLDLEDGRFSVHDCASVLKGFLAELPEPLLTDLHYPAHCQIAELYSLDANANDSRLLRSLQLLLLLLPTENRTLLKHVLILLNKTATFECSNKMNCDTLATLFTPHLMCPRKLSPEALHITSQNLSGLVAFMIRKGMDLFEIPPKLATDIRAYWVEQERKLLSPKKTDLNESTSDATSTAHTVFSFVDHKLTAKANSTQDTQAALAQLYAHIQAMPESAKKRRLVKQFNKENGQGTPRQVKHYRTKSLGDSIKKHIFQKKLLGHKKLIDINIGCNISRSSSEENILSTSLEKSLLPSKTLFSKSDDELSIDNSDTLESENLLQIKHMSNSTGSLDTPALASYKGKKKVMLMSFVNIGEEDEGQIKGNKKESIQRLQKEEAIMSDDTSATTKSEEKISPMDEKCTNNKSRSLHDISRSATVTLSRNLSEPNDLYSQTAFNEIDEKEKELVRQISDTIYPVSRCSNIEVVFTPRNSMPDLKSTRSPTKLDPSLSSTSIHSPPMAKNKFWNLYNAHTSTPSNLLRRSLVTNDYLLTPIADHDKSMSPITQSTTKMSKAMQETMMTPRSRKPVIMVSGSNLCNLATLNNGWSQYGSTTNLRGSNVDLVGRKNCTSILEESQKADSTSSEIIPLDNTDSENKENNISDDKCEDLNFVTSVEDNYGSIMQRSPASITSTFREYLLSRSVLTASPVDLSFTSRTGDFEQSESDLNILNEDRLSDSLLHCLDGNNPGSDTSGIASGSTNSANNSMEKIEDAVLTPRKRGTSLQRNDSKRSVREKTMTSKLKTQALKNKQLSESTINSIKLKETFQETSF